jgi:CYTH domain-containing protein
VVRIRRITDSYIDGTTLRLRQQSEVNAPTPIFKLTQKVPARPNGAQEGLTTSMYLTKGEFCVLAQLPAKKLSKRRHSVPRLGIDVFEGALEGLLLGKAEFDLAAAVDALAIPSFILAEVSADDQLTGGRLVRASRDDVQTWLMEYGIGLESS